MREAEASEFNFAKQFKTYKSGQIERYSRTIDGINNQSRNMSGFKLSSKLSECEIIKSDDDQTIFHKDVKMAI